VTSRDGEWDEPEVLRRVKRGLAGRQIPDAFRRTKLFGTDALGAISRLTAD